MTIPPIHWTVPKLEELERCVALYWNQPVISFFDPCTSQTLELSYNHAACLASYLRGKLLVEGDLNK